MDIKIIGTQTVYKGFFNMLELTIKDGDSTYKREIFSRCSKGNSEDSVAAIVYDTKMDKYIFVSQFRAGLYREMDKNIVELVAGTVKLSEGDDKENCMKREILEEIGYKTDSIKLISDFYVSPGGSAEKVYLYYIEVSEKVEEGGGLEEENENIEIVYMSMYDMKNYIFKDAKTIIGINYI